MTTATARTTTRTGAVVRVLAAIGIAEGFAVIILNAVNGHSLREAVVNYSVACVVFAWTTTPIAALILQRHPGHRVGWLLMWTGVATPAQVVIAQVAVLIRPSDATRFSDLGFVAQVLEWLPFWAWALMVFPFITLLPLHFPDGRLPSGRWRGVSAAAIVVILAITVGQAGGYWAWHPDAVLAEVGAWTPLVRVADIAFPAFSLVALACLASVVVRYRRAVGVVRQQMKLLLFSVAITVPAMTLCLIAIDAGETFWPILGVSVLIVPIPLAMGIAILRHGLFDVDVVINRTIVFAVLAVFITAVYAAVVVGLGALLPTSDLVLSIAATTVVAMAFEPVRARVQHWANVAVFGRRATPYEVLARMTSRVGAAVDVDVALGDAAVLLAEGTGAALATVWLRRGGVLHPVASAPTPDPDRHPAPVPVVDADGPLGIDADLTVPVHHEGGLVGAPSLSKRPGEGVSTADRRLVEELAGQAALVLATTRLRARLRSRLAELRESRRRLVAAQDRARRTLERNLHDGAQQELVALKIKLGLVRTIAQREGVETIADRLDAAVQAADRVIDDLRDVARGIYPPLLESEGLPAALVAQTRKLDVATTVLDRGTGRHAREVEATAYFCALEALGNTQRHAGATAAQVVLEQPDDDTLVVTITDDGRGFDAAVTPLGDGLTHMTDRVDACGGTLVITARPGHGTSVQLTLPSGGSAAGASARVPQGEDLVDAGQAAISEGRRSSSTNGSNPPLETKSSAPAARA